MHDVDVVGHVYLQNINRNVAGKDQRSKLMATFALIGIIDQSDIDVTQMTFQHLPCPLFLESSDRFCASAELP